MITNWQYLKNADEIVDRLSKTPKSVYSTKGRMLLKKMKEKGADGAISDIEDLYLKLVEAEGKHDAYLERLELREVARGQYLKSADEIVARITDSDDSLSGIKALALYGKLPRKGLDAVEDTYSKLVALENEHDEEKCASKTSYRQVLERADSLGDHITSGLVGEGLVTQFRYRKTLDSVYKRIDDAMDLGGEEGQRKLAKQVSELDALEAKLNAATVSRITSVAKKAEAAYVHAVVRREEPSDIRSELFSGTKHLHRLAIDVAYDGFRNRDITMYANAVKELEALADDVLTEKINGKNINRYVLPPYMFDSARL